MTNKEILVTLSELESVLYYRADGSDNPESVDTETTKEIHAIIRKALEKWHEATGETL